jgi:protein ImuB
MGKRFVSIWFRYLKTDWFSLRRPELRELPFVLAAPDHGRMVISAANRLANEQGIHPGMVLADARAIFPSLQVLDDKPGLSEKLLKALAEWFIRYTPIVTVDVYDGLILDATGCAHLWGGEQQYLDHIVTRLKNLGYTIRISMADTIGCAWAFARYGNHNIINEITQICGLPSESLRLEPEIIDRLHKLGLRRIENFIGMPGSALRKRFGQTFIQRLDQALGREEETIQPVQPIEPYHERLPCLEPVVTATGIEIALQRLLDTICNRLASEEKGLRTAIFKCYRIDGKIEKIQIGTNRATHNTRHLFKLFEIKLPTIEPALGIELFTLEAPKVEEVCSVQEKLWDAEPGLDDTALSELLDRLAGKIGSNCIHRYIPDEHYWPERSFKPATSIHEKLTTPWKLDRPRPLHVLPKPERIDVTAPIPDYPPMLFRYKGQLHKIIKADGPERIEQEWWLQQGQHRDYYCVEDEQGHRYWVFRSGHYDGDKSYQWFIHGFFA